MLKTIIIIILICIIIFLILDKKKVKMENFKLFLLNIYEIIHKDIDDLKAMGTNKQFEFLLEFERGVSH